MFRPPPRSTRTDTLFPYTTLFRSQAGLRQALVRTIGGPAVTDDVLDAGDRVGVVVEAALQAARVAGGVLAHQRRILRPALVRAPPARVLHHRDRKSTRLNSSH